MTTEFKSGCQPKAQEFLVPPIKAGGWLAFFRLKDGCWMQVYPVHGKQTDFIRHPAPLHDSKEAAVDAAQDYMRGSPKGGVIKVFYIELDE